MSFIKDKDKPAIREKLNHLISQVKIINFTQEMECMFCQNTRQMMEDLTALSDKLSVEVYHFVKDRIVAEKYNIDKIPATILLGEKNYGIRYFGIPAGYEFASLLDTIVAISTNNSGLSEKSRRKLKTITEPLHIQVFVSPTCPYCPTVVQLAHACALENDNISADMIEIGEFPHLVAKYAVRGIPKTVINDKVIIEGAVSEADFVDRLFNVFEPIE